MSFICKKHENTPHKKITTTLGRFTTKSMCTLLKKEILQSHLGRPNSLFSHNNFWFLVKKENIGVKSMFYNYFYVYIIWCIISKLIYLSFWYKQTKITFVIPNSKKPKKPTTNKTKKVILHKGYDPRTKWQHSTELSRQ